MDFVKDYPKRIQSRLRRRDVVASKSEISKWMLLINPDAHSLNFEDEAIMSEMVEQIAIALIKERQSITVPMPPSAQDELVFRPQGQQKVDLVEHHLQELGIVLSEEESEDLYREVCDVFRSYEEFVTHVFEVVQNYVNERFDKTELLIENSSAKLKEQVDDRLRRVKIKIAAIGQSVGLRGVKEELVKSRQAIASKFKT